MYGASLNEIEVGSIEKLVKLVQNNITYKANVKTNVHLIVTPTVFFGRKFTKKKGQATFVFVFTRTAHVLSIHVPYDF